MQSLTDCNDEKSPESQHERLPMFIVIDLDWLDWLGDYCPCPLCRSRELELLIADAGRDFYKFISEWKK